MKHYIRTLFAGLLGLIGGSIAYISSIPVYIQFSITGLTGVLITIIALSDRNKQLTKEFNNLVDKMRYHINYVFLTNQSESEQPIEAYELFNHFKEYDEKIRIRAIAQVFKMSLVKANEMVKAELPDYILKNMDIFRIAKY